MKSGNLLHFFATQVADQCLSYGRRLWRHTPAVPDVHLDETRRLDPFDVNGFAVVEDREMRTQTRGLGNLAQVRHGELAQSHALHRLAAKTQNAYAERMLSGFEVASHVATPHESSQQVAGRTLRHFRYAADLGRAKTVIPAG